MLLVFPAGTIVCIAASLDAGASSLFPLFFVTRELSALRLMTKVPNETGLSPNNGLKNVSLSD